MWGIIGTNSRRFLDYLPSRSNCVTFLRKILLTANCDPDRHLICRGFLFTWDFSKISCIVIFLPLTLFHVFLCNLFLTFSKFHWTHNTFKVVFYLKRFAIVVSNFCFLYSSRSGRSCYSSIVLLLFSSSPLSIVNLVYPS